MDWWDYIYSPPDHAVPASVIQNEKKQLTHAQHRHFNEGLKKPDSAILVEILRQINCSPQQCLYLGDSLMKDVAMAQDAGIMDVLAGYGGAQHREEYELLRKVSHWTDEDVAREQSISKRSIVPTHTILEFADIKKFLGG